MTRARLFPICRRFAFIFESLLSEIQLGTRLALLTAQWAFVVEILREAFGVSIDEFR
jgi:hypothetical protein